MKTTMHQQLTALLILIFIPLMGLADNDYTKTYNKAFSANGVEKLLVENKYGNINIKNWNKAEVSVKVTVTVEAGRESKARDVFDDIHVNIEQSGSEILARTSFDMSFSNTNFSVDYEIFMPAGIDVALDNKYGDVYINELTGHADLTVKYGTLRINKLARGDVKPHNRIDIAYCKNSHIREAGWLKLNASYSDIEVERSTALMVLSKYSKLYTETGNSIVAEGKYDNYSLGILDKFIVDSKYSDFSIDKIKSRIEVEVKYTDMKVREVSADFSSIDIDAAYGEIELGIAENASYKLNADIQYADIDYPSSKRIQVDEGYTDKHVKGYIGSADNPDAWIKIVTRYCDIELE